MNATIEEAADSDNPRRAAFLDLLDRGFRILPVRKGEKRPDPLLAPQGFFDCTKMSDSVDDWLNVKPDINVGVVVGADDKLVVLDVDTKNGARGMDTLRDLWIDTPTLTCETPSGGLHLYFRHPGVPLTAKLEGIDIKGADGAGYVLAPPSHTVEIPGKQCEGVYRWKDAEIPIAEFPKFLLDELRADRKPGTPKANGAAPVKGPAEVLKVPAGNRHNRLLELGAVYRGKGLDADDIETLLWSHAERYFDPPFSRTNPQDAREVEQVVHWFRSKPAPDAVHGSLKVITTAELRRLAKASPTEALLDPPLPENSSMMIYGATGIGKSHIGLCIAGALALGQPFLDWSVSRPVQTLYIDGENPLEELDVRIAAYFGTLPLERLSWIAARAHDDDLPNLADEAAQEMYFAAIVAAGAKAVVFDNLSCLRSTSAELPENSTEAWQPVGKFIRRLNRAGVAVILIHHANKAGSQKGSGAHTFPMETVLCLRALPEGQPDPRAENDIEFVFEKHRRFGGDAALTFRAQAWSDADGRVTWRRAGGDPLAEEVARLTLAGQSIRDIAQATRRNPSTVQKAKTRAKARGLLPLKDDDA